MSMSVRIVFGLLLLSVSRKLIWLSGRLGKRAIETDQIRATNKTLIWDVIDGPFSRDDFDEYDLLAEGIPPDLNSMLVVRIEEDGVMDTVNFWYDTEEDALEVVKYFKWHMEPLEIK
jgi:hypothetical protein